MTKPPTTQAVAQPAEVDNEFATVLEEHLRAGYQMMFVQTPEEARVESEIGRVVKGMNQKFTGLVTWDCFEGFSGPECLKEDVKLKNPLAALEAVIDDKKLPKDDKNGNFVFVFRDVDDYMQDPNFRRRLKSLAEGNRLVNKNRARPIIIVSPTLNIHPKLRSSITVIDFALPSEHKLARQIEFVRQSVESKDPNRAKVTPELAALLATNLLGLTSTEAENCLSRCLVRHAGFKDEMLSTIKDEKAAIVKKSEVMTYIPEDSCRSREDIGGYDLYMDWLDRRKLAYSSEARLQNLDYPKGVVLLGLPGTGKSMVAKATCMVLGLPGYILDVGALFGSLVGESEQRTRDALKQINAQKGCVLLIDEADKALGNAHSSTGDSGVTRRVFGTILTWLAENNSRTFCIMTLNRTEGLPPELTRAGRFDAMFFTDLPTELERRQILEIHMRRRGVDPTALSLGVGEWSELLQKTQGYVGAELETIVREARYMAFERTKSGMPDFGCLMEAASAVVPMTVADPEGMKEIRNYCKDKAKPVTSPAKTKVVAGGRQSRVVDVNNG